MYKTHLNLEVYIAKLPVRWHGAQQGPPLPPCATLHSDKAFNLKKEGKRLPEHTHTHTHKYHHHLLSHRGLILA